MEHDPSLPPAYSATPPSASQASCLTPLVDSQLSLNNFDTEEYDFSVQLRHKSPLPQPGPVTKRKRVDSKGTEGPKSKLKMSGSSTQGPDKRKDVEMSGPPVPPTHPPYGYIELPNFGEARKVYAPWTSDTLPQDTPMIHPNPDAMEASILGKSFKPNTCSPDPLGGIGAPFRSVDMRDIWLNLTHESASSLNKVFGHRLVVTIAHAQRRRAFTMQEMKGIKALVKPFMPDGVDPTLHPSELVPLTSATAPQPWLMGNITKEVVKGLAGRTFISQPGGNIFFDRLRPRPSPYVMTITGLLLDYTYENENLVADVIINELCTSEDFIAYFRKPRKYHELVPDSPDDASPEKRATIVLNTIFVSGAVVTETWGTTTNWRVYMRPPTAEIEYLDELYDTMRATVFPTTSWGIGRPKDVDSQCGECRSRDHKTAYCPFRLLPGYFQNDPKLERRFQPTLPGAAGNEGGNSDDDDDNLPTIGFDLPANNNHHRKGQTPGSSRPARGRGGKKAGGVTKKEKRRK